MCGINGFNFKDEELIGKMNIANKHRGPDGTGFFVDENISLGHNRLSIIDLSKEANQPMQSNDGRLILVFNGEIYNYRELKKELTEYNFKTQSDSEVIIASYEKWGADCVKYFNGIFAFAIWDTKSKELFLARDHNGIKPLYYYLSTENNNPNLVFSSEIKSILEHKIPRKIRRESLSHYLRVLYVPGPYTMFEGIMKLPPASSALFKNGKLSISNYWKPTSEKYFSDKKNIIKDNLVTKIREAVNRQLISDRPLGIFLSGGLDSTIILHHVSEFRKNIDTYSLGFELSKEEQKERFNEDFDLARRTGEVYKTNHHEVLMSASDVTGNIEDAVWHLDEPIANPTIIAQYILARFSKNTVDVVLGGDGGDELFGGYERYRLGLYTSYYLRLPAFLRFLGNSIPFFKKINVSSRVERFSKFLFQKDKIIEEVAPDFLNGDTLEFFDNSYFKELPKDSFEKDFMEVDRKSWLIDESLLRTDKMTMSFGLEARVPFLDKSIIEFSNRIPTHYKVNLFRNKVIIRDAYRGIIPDFIIDQPKRGWFSPGAKWLRNKEIFNFAEKVLSPKYYNATENLFDWGNIKNVLRDHKNKTRYNSTMLWALIIFQIWARRYEVKI